MNASLRARYFLSLIGLLGITYGAFLVSVLLFNLYEWNEHGALKQQEANETLVLLGLVLVSVPVVLWAAWRIAGQLLNPLRAVLGTAERIGAGNLGERIPVRGKPHDELTRLALTLNNAFDRYADAVARLDRFSADAAHQLRTPLSAMRAAAEVCLQKARTPEEYREALADVLEELDRLTLLVEQLLALARMDPSLLKRAEPIELRAALSECVSKTAAMCEAAGIRLEGPAAGPPVHVMTFPDLLPEAYMNLLNNAIAATPAGGVVRCGVERMSDGRAAWWMEDSGPGIPPGDRARVLERFYRGAGATGRGSGLGLAIVQQIAALHGGRVEIDKSDSLGGALVRIVWPA